MRLQLQYEREDITLAKETDNSYQPDFGLVVNSHRAQFFLSLLISLSWLFISASAQIAAPLGIER